MPTPKQTTSAQQNIKKAQQAWKEMTPRQHALAQPQGKGRAEIGSKGEGDYYRVEVRPSVAFTTFRYHDVGKPGGILRLAGKRSSGSWDDQAWLIEKNMAHVEDGLLVGDDPDAKDILKIIGPAKHTKGDVFQGHPRKDVPEKEKPTSAQVKAQQTNIKKAQTARWQH